MTETDAKTRQLSAKQKEILVNFVYARPEMQKGKFTPTYTKVVANALWEQVTATLNSVPIGAIKTPIQWSKVKFLLLLQWIFKILSLFFIDMERLKKKCKK